MDLKNDFDCRQVVKILYTNYRGETAVREILPIKIWFGKNEWHTEEQWLLDAFDIDKKANRAFAMKNIKAWFVEKQ